MRMPKKEPVAITSYSENYVMFNSSWQKDLIYLYLGKTQRQKNTLLSGSADWLGASGTFPTYIYKDISITF